MVENICPMSRRSCVRGAWRAARVTSGRLEATAAVDRRVTGSRDAAAASALPARLSVDLLGRVNNRERCQPRQREQNVAGIRHSAAGCDNSPPAGPDKYPSIEATAGCMPGRRREKPRRDARDKDDRLNCGSSSGGEPTGDNNEDR